MDIVRLTGGHTIDFDRIIDGHTVNLSRLNVNTDVKYQF